MNKNVGYALAGILGLLLIVPSVSVVEQISGGQVIEDQPITKTLENSETGDDYYTSEWEIENADGSLYYMWSVEKPTDSEITTETDITDSSNISDVQVNTEDVTTYPIAPWMATLLRVIVPLTLLGGAVVSFSKIGSFVELKKMLNSFNDGVKLSSRGRIGAGSLIGTVIGVMIATIVLVKTLPILQSFAENISGLYGFGFLIPLIPVFLVILVFYKVVDEVK